MSNTMIPDGIWIKHEAESQFRGFTLEGLASGETVVSATVAVVPEDDLTVTTPATVSGADVSSLISAGIAGHEYLVRFIITTSQQPAIVKDLAVKVIG